MRKHIFTNAAKLIYKLLLHNKLRKRKQVTSNSPLLKYSGLSSVFFPKKLSARFLFLSRQKRKTPTVSIRHTVPRSFEQAEKNNIP